MFKNIKKVGMFIYLLSILTAFDRGLTKKGFKNIFDEYVARHSKATNETKSISNMQLVKIVNYFEMLDVVCAWYPRKADCIHKTFLGYKFLQRKYGIPVEMVVGIRKFPFQAHAWLRLNEENFFENEEDTTTYKIILSSNAVEGGGIE